MRPVAPGSPTPPTGVRGLRNEGAAGAVLPCAANRWRPGTRLGRGQRWQAVGGEKTRCALALRQVTAGGRPSRGAEQKARCRLPEDMCEAHLRRGLRGRHGKRRANDQKAKAVGNGDWDARQEPRQRSVCRGTAEGAGGVCQGRRHKKAHGFRVGRSVCAAQHFFISPCNLPLAAPLQPQED